MANQTFVQVLISTLSKLLPADRIYNEVPPDSVDFTKPMVIFQRLTSQLIYFSEGDVAQDKRNSYVRLNVWCNQAKVRDALCVDIIREFARHPLCQPMSEAISNYDDALKVFGASIDISIWAAPKV